MPATPRSGAWRLPELEALPDLVVDLDAGGSKLRGYGLGVCLFGHRDDVLARQLSDELRVILGDVLLDFGNDLVLRLPADDAAALAIDQH
jgi:hypothetical protein